MTVDDVEQFSWMRQHGANRNYQLARSVRGLQGKSVTSVVTWFVLIERVFLHYDWYFLSIPISAEQRLLSFNIIPIGGGFTDDSTNSAGSDTQFNLPQFHCYQCLHPHGIREKANFENHKQQV